MLDELLSPLLRYSLLRRNEETRSYILHPLLREVIREGLSKEEQRTCAKSAVNIVNAAFPSPGKFENWLVCDRLLPHALACGGLISSFRLTFPGAAVLLNRTAAYVYERGQYVEAESLYKHALKIRQKTMGAEDANTAGILNNLAGLYCAQSRYEEAESLVRRALGIFEKAYGQGHRETIITMNNLAGICHAQGRYTEAVALLERTLEIREKEFGRASRNCSQSQQFSSLVWCHRRLRRRRIPCPACYIYL